MNLRAHTTAASAQRAETRRCASLPAAVLAALLAASGAAVYAQQPPASAAAGVGRTAPSQAELEAARGALPSREELNRAGALARQSIGEGPRVPSIATDPRRAAGAVDLSDLAQQYERMRLGPNANAAAAQAQTDREATGLMVFVSLGLPAATLERLIDDAQRLRAPLVLRGVAGGLRQTTLRIEQLNAGRQVAWQIDPALFKRFDVRAVPAFVLVDPARPVQLDCAGAAGAGLSATVASATLGACRPGAASAQADAFSKVSGDVSFAHALAEIERVDTAFAELARRYAARLRQGVNR